MAAGDFWGEVQATTVRTPLAILREQAAMLGPKTNYLLEARVDTNVDEDRRFIHRFNLVVLLSTITPISSFRLCMVSICTQ